MSPTNDARDIARSVSVSAVMSLHVSGWRLCSRPDCARVARACLTYDYSTSTVWLDPLPADSDPNHYDLCEHHATHLRVPHGWELLDRRVAAAS